MNPHDAIKIIKQKISPKDTGSFISTIIIGLVTHLFIFTNYIPNWDGFNNLYSYQNTISLGRCFLSVACGISSFYDLPLINGLLCLFYLGLISVLLCRLFEIKRTSYRILISGLIVAFPSITSTFAYMYTADGYILATLFMISAVFLSLNTKKGIFLSPLLVAFAFGCYQATISVAIMTLLVYFIIKLIFTEESIKNLLKRVVFSGLSCIIGFIVYYFANKVLLIIEGATLASYQGISSMHLVNPLISAKKCFIDCAYFFLGSISKISFFAIINILFSIIGVFCLVYAMVKKNIFHSPAKVFFIVISLVSIPFSCFIVYFISSEVQYHTLMESGIILVYLLFIVIFDKISFESKINLSQWAAIIICCLEVLYFIIIANICYQRQNISYQKSMNVMNEIAYEIVNITDYDSAQKIAVVGHLSNEESISLLLPPEMVGFSDSNLMTNSVHYSNILRNYYDLRYTPVDSDLLNSDDFQSQIKNIPCWPNSGSIQIISDMLIINFGDN